MSVNCHITPVELDRLAKGHTTRANALSLVLHLQACQECLLTFQRKYRWECENLWSRLLGDLNDVPATPATRTDALQPRYETKAKLAKSALDRLREVAPERRHLVVRNSQSFSSPVAVQLLLENSRAEWYQSPQWAVHWAQLALIAVETLSAHSYSAQLVADYAGRAWSYLGNARRIAVDFASAEAGLNTAAFWLARGTADPFEMAKLYCLRNLLARDQRRFREALTLGQQALTLFRAAGAMSRAAWQEVNNASTSFDAQDFGTAVQALTALLGRLKQSTVDPEVLVAGRHNLALALVEVGRIEQASVLLGEARSMPSTMSGSLKDARFEWLDGRIQAKSGMAAAAEVSLDGVRQLFLSEGAIVDAALVGLDLAKLCKEQNWRQKTNRYAAEAEAAFLDLGSSYECEAAEARKLLG